jgi:hypothetical protein
MTHRPPLAIRHNDENPRREKPMWRHTDIIGEPLQFFSSTKTTRRSGE